MAGIKLSQGDQEYRPPAWRRKLDLMRQKNGYKDIASEDIKDYFIEENEIALKHPHNDSIVKLTDDGFVDMFAGPALGIRIDPITNTCNIIGDNVNIISKNLNFVTKPNGLVWNGYYFNPELYTETNTERGQRISGTKEYYHETHESDPEDRSVRWHEDTWSIRPMVPTESKRRYSEGMIEMMNRLGLPTE